MISNIDTIHDKLNAFTNDLDEMLIKARMGHLQNFKPLEHEILNTLKDIETLPPKDAQNIQGALGVVISRLDELAGLLGSQDNQNIGDKD